MNRTEIIIVEDDIDLSTLLKALINATNDFICIGIAQSYDEYVDLLKISVPEISLVDIDLKDKKTGLDIIKYINDNNITTDVLVHTVHDDRETLFEALKLGAGGYILKGSSPIEFLTFLSNIKKGDVPMSPKIARRIISFFSRKQEDEYENLTPREQEVLELTDQGYTYAQVAEITKLSPNTIHSYMKQIYNKLRVNSKQEALRKAKKINLL